MPDYIVPDKNGNPVFIGREDPTNPPVRTSSSQMECPVCHEMFDYLVGEDTNDGGVKGCEADWKPSKKGVNMAPGIVSEPEII